MGKPLSLVLQFGSEAQHGKAAGSETDAYNSFLLLQIKGIQNIVDFLWHIAFPYLILFFSLLVQCGHLKEVGTLGKFSSWLTLPPSLP